MAPMALEKNIELTDQKTQEWIENKDFIGRPA